MRPMGIVVIQESVQAMLELRGRGKVSPFEESPCQHAEPQLDLIEPGSVFGGEDEPIAVVRIGQKGPTLGPGSQRLGVSPRDC